MLYLIDRRMLLNEMCKSCGSCKKIADMGGDPFPCRTFEIISNLPNMAVEKHGTWNFLNNSDFVATDKESGVTIDIHITSARCSECDEWVEHVTAQEDACYKMKQRFCPYCGAEMKGGAE